jgi:hypothetical protein
MIGPRLAQMWGMTILLIALKEEHSPGGKFLPGTGRELKEPAALCFPGPFLTRACVPFLIGNSPGISVQSFRVVR